MDYISKGKMFTNRGVNSFLRNKLIVHMEHFCFYFYFSSWNMGRTLYMLRLYFCSGYKSYTGNPHSQTHTSTGKVMLYCKVLSYKISETDSLICWGEEKRGDDMKLYEVEVEDTVENQGALDRGEEDGCSWTVTGLANSISMSESCVHCVSPCVCRVTDRLYWLVINKCVQSEQATKPLFQWRGEGIY